MVDSPVSGSVITLQEGKLSVMVGGRKGNFRKSETAVAGHRTKGDIRPGITVWRW